MVLKTRFEMTSSHVDQIHSLLLKCFAGQKFQTHGFRVSSCEQVTICVLCRVLHVLYIGDHAPMSMKLGEPGRCPALHPENAGAEIRGPGALAELQDSNTTPAWVTVSPSGRLGSAFTLLGRKLRYAQIKYPPVHWPTVSSTPFEAGA